MPAEDSPPELAGHLKTCSACRTMAEQLAKMDQAVRDMPIPPQSAQAKEAFLQQFQAPIVPAAPARPLLWKVIERWHFAAAATILFALGVGLWMNIANRDTTKIEVATAGPSVRDVGNVSNVDRLVEWNLQLADTASLEERQVLYDVNVGQFRQLADKEPAGSEDSPLMRTLLDNGAWLCRNNDPLAEAEKFNVVADVLVDQLAAVAGRSDDETLRKIANRYEAVEEKAINASLRKAARENKADNDRIKKIDNVLRHCADRQKRMEKMAEKMSGAPKKETQRILDNSRQRHIDRKHLLRTNQHPASAPAAIPAKSAEWC